MANETKEQMHERFENQVTELKEQLATANSEIDRLNAHVGDLEQSVHSKISLAEEFEAEAERLKADLTACQETSAEMSQGLFKFNTESRWKEVDGTRDQHGVLQALPIGDFHSPGVLLRFLHVDGEVTVMPYPTARAIDLDGVLVELSYVAK